MNSDNSIQIRIASLVELRLFARAFITGLQSGAVIGLFGTLGAGKTEFVRNVVRELGGAVEEVISPTFVLEAVYPLPGTVISPDIESIRQVNHWDLYRLGDGVEAPAELEELVGANGVVTFVEWPERCPGLLNLLCIDLVLDANLTDISGATLVMDPVDTNAEQLELGEARSIRICFKPGGVGGFNRTRFVRALGEYTLSLVPL